MFNNTTANSWLGPVYGYDNTVADGEMKNAWFFQGRVGVTPAPKLNVAASVSYAMVDKKGALANGSYGGN